MMNKVIDWCKENINKELISPRIKAFHKGKKPQNFYLVEVNENEKKIKVEFKDSSTILPLEFWRFNVAIDYLQKENDYVWLGTKLYAEGKDNLESYIQKTAKQIYGRNVDTKTASHVGDILVFQVLQNMIQSNLQTVD